MTHHRRPADRVPGTIDSWYLVRIESRRREKLLDAEARLAKRRARRDRIESWFPQRARRALDAALAKVGER